MRKILVFLEKFKRDIDPKKEAKMLLKRYSSALYKVMNGGN